MSNRPAPRDESIQKVFTMKLSHRLLRNLHLATTGSDRGWPGAQPKPRAHETPRIPHPLSVLFDGCSRPRSSRSCSWDHGISCTGSSHPRLRTF
jgi:hypothetical protein